MDNNWLNALGQMTYGIYVLSCRYKQTINGMIASWVSQVSYEPPLIMVAVHPNRFSHKLIEQSRSFALHAVEHTRTEMLRRMKGPDPKAKFDGLDWSPGRTGCPILQDCLAWWECEVIDQLQPGNHTLFIGKIIDAQHVSDGRPLCSFDYKGRYSGAD
jgi:flavin reductase (DIM6/NTAB) family NADH-FMN oxidoreductase RutF